MRCERLLRFVVFAGVFGTIGMSQVAVSGANPSSDWPSYLADGVHSSFNPGATTITPANVSDLGVAWQFHAPDVSGKPATRLYASPTVYAGAVYVGSNTGVFYKLDEATGQVLWSDDLGYTPSATCRGKGILSTATVATDPVSGVLTVYVGAGDGNVDAVRASDGTVLWSSPVNVNAAGQSAYYNFSSTVVYGGRVYQGISSSCDDPLVRGGLVALDQHTGALDATYYTVPAGSVGGSIWSSPAMSSDGTSVFVTTGNGDQTAGAAQGDSISIVKLDAATLAKQDIWTVPINPPNDSDFGGSPTMFTATLNGVSTPMVGAFNKNGIYYAWKQADLASGPVWQSKIGSGEVGAAVWDGSHLFIAAQNATIGGTTYAGGIRELDPATGAAVWETGVDASGLGFGTPTLDGGGVLAVPTWNVTTPSANVDFLVDASNGTVLRQIPLTSATFAQTVFAQDTAFVTDGTAATLYAYRVSPPSAGDLGVSQSASPAKPTADGTLTYTVTVSNGGSGSATGVSLSDTLPSTSQLVSATSTAGSCSSTTPVSCNLGTLNAGASATVTITTTPIAPGVVTNTATVSPTDATPADNTSQLSSTVKAQKGTKYVTVDDSGFTPAILVVAPGTTVQWNFLTGGHSAADGALVGCTTPTPCSLFDSGIEPAVAYFRFTITAAGSYPVVDAGSAHTALVNASTAVSPMSGTASGTYTVTWATGPAAAGYVYDVQIRRPGSKAWTLWQSGVTAPSATFTSASPLWAGTGVYQFRGRLRNAGTGNATGYGPTSKRLTIS